MKTSKELKDAINRGAGKLQYLIQQKDTLEAQLIASKKLQESIDKAVVLLQTVAKDTQEQLKYHIEDIVQLAADACFPLEYTFRMDFEMKRGRTEANIFLLKNGNRIDPMEASGGGLVDVLSFALRFAAWSLSKTSPIIVLDEPFKHLSKDLQPMIFQIVKQLSEKLKIQIIAVTHNEEMIQISDKVFFIHQIKDSEGHKVSEIYRETTQ